MAEVLVKFDTVTKALAVTIDGKTVDDVCAASFSQQGHYDYQSDRYVYDENEYGCYISTCMEDEESDIKTYMSMTASALPQRATAGKAEASEQFPGFVTRKDVGLTTLDAEVASFLGQ